MYNTSFHFIYLEKQPKVSYNPNAGGPVVVEPSAYVINKQPGGTEYNPQQGGAIYGPQQNMPFGNNQQINMRV